MPREKNKASPIYLDLTRFSTAVKKKKIEDIKTRWNGSAIVRSWYTGQAVPIAKNDSRCIEPSELIKVFDSFIKTKKEEVIQLFCANNSGLIAALKAEDISHVATLLLKLMGITSSGKSPFLYKFVKQVIHAFEEEEGQRLLQNMLAEVNAKPNINTSWLQKGKKQLLELIRDNKPYPSKNNENTVVELSPIHLFKEAISRPRGEVQKLWAKPEVKSWFAGNPMEITNESGTRSITIDEDELYNVYLSLLRAHNSPMAEQFWDNNRLIAEIVKTIAERNDTKRERFLTSLLAADCNGSSRHVYDVLKLFPKDLLQEIKDKTESSSTGSKYSTYKKGRINLLDTVLNDRPYNSTKAQKKSDDPFLRKLQEFTAKLAKREFKTIDDIEAYDSTVLPWFFGEPVLDNSTGQERIITAQELIDFLKIVLKIKNLQLMSDLLINNKALINVVTKLPDAEMKEIITTVLASSSHGNSRFIRQFFSSMVDHDSRLAAVLEEMKSALETESQENKLSPYKKGQLRALTDYPNEKKIPQEEVLPLTPSQAIVEEEAKVKPTKRQKNNQVAKDKPSSKKPLSKSLKKTSEQPVATKKRAEPDSLKTKKLLIKRPRHQVDAEAPVPSSKRTKKESSKESLPPIKNSKKYSASFFENKLTISWRERSLTSSSDMTSIEPDSLSDEMDVVTEDVSKHSSGAVLKQGIFGINALKKPEQPDTDLTTDPTPLPCEKDVIDPTEHLASSPEFFAKKPTTEVVLSEWFDYFSFNSTTP